MESRRDEAVDEEAVKANRIFCAARSSVLPWSREKRRTDNPDGASSKRRMNHLERVLTVIFRILLLTVQVWLVTATLFSLTLASINCDVARLKCSYRVGCGMALHNYVMGCADVIAGRTTLCSDQCTRALIALMSTEEGQALTHCNCRDDDFCKEAKKRVEVCRPEVTRATHKGTVVSCSVAQLICAADTLCSTALEYYHRFCRPMIQGRKCTYRCNNSIAILNRQQKADKLRSCYCDGTEDFDCDSIKDNMERLCFQRDASLSSTRSSISVAGSSAPLSSNQNPGVTYQWILFIIFLLFVFISRT